MRRAVVFIGGSRDIATALQRAVTGNVRALARAGVTVPKAGRRASNRNGLSHQRLAAPGSADWSSLEEELGESSGDTILLVIPGLLRMGGATARHRAVVEQLNAVADEVHVVSVVADQLTLINEYYLHHVATWRTSARLENLASKLFHNEIFVHERLLRPWYEETAVHYIAVPHNHYVAGNPLEVVLAAAGVVVGRASRARAPGVLTLGSVGRGGEPAALDIPPGRGPGLPPGRQAGGGRQPRGAGSRGEAGLVRRPFWGWTTRAAERGARALRRLEPPFRAGRSGAPTGRSPTRCERAGTQLDFLDLDIQDDRPDPPLRRLDGRPGGGQARGDDLMRLVLHAGAEFADSGAVHRDLVAIGRRSVRRGVVLPPRDDRPSWRETRGRSAARRPQRPGDGRARRGTTARRPSWSAPTCWPTRSPRPTRRPGSRPGQPPRVSTCGWSWSYGSRSATSTPSTAIAS